MVEPKIKRWSYFVSFVLPCLILYIIFFIVPFFNGIGISFTNWDGLTQKIPIVMQKDEFQSKILDNLKNDKDKEFLLSVYSYDSKDNSYHRESVGGIKKYKIQKIIKRSKYQPEKYKFVGLQNYKNIFTGKVDANFYPHKTRIEKFNKNSDLPSSIDAVQFEKEILSALEKKEKKFDSQTIESEIEIIKNAYRYNEEKRKYYLNREFDEFAVVTPVWTMKQVVETKTIPENEVDFVLREIKKYAVERDTFNVHKSVRDFSQKFNLSQEESDMIMNVSNEIIDIVSVKNILAENWVVYQNYMGVIGFTIFFAVFSVLGINCLAFALALALDTGIRGQKFLRTIFFLPNVLSMIIVALIWNMLFVQLLPTITGVEKWLSDPNKAPILLVIVAVWQGAGYYMIVYLAGLQNIPTEIVEAAKIDGATGWQRFRFITIPMMIPAITISLFLTIANALKSFDLMYALVGSTGYATGTVPLVYDIFFQAYSLHESGMATAKAMVLFFVIVIVTGIQLFTMKRKEIDA